MAHFASYFRRVPQRSLGGRVARSHGCEAALWLVGLLLIASAGCAGDDAGDAGDAADAAAAADGGDAAVDARLDGARADVLPDSASDAGAADAPDASVSACGCTAAPPWRCEPCLDVPLQEISAIELDGDIVVVGGFEGRSGAVATVRRFDVETGVWDELPALPDIRHHVQLANDDGDLYVIGGMRDLSFSALSRSYVLPSGATEWEELPTPPRPRAAGFAAIVDGVLIVAGGQGEGRTDEEKLTHAAPVMRFDLSTQMWSLGADIPSPREHIGGVEHEGEIWIFGGRPVSLEPVFDTVEVYDARTDTWRDGPSMPTAHGGFAAALVDGIAYVGGGETRARALTEFEALNLSTGEWTNLAALPSPRHGHAMASVGGRVFLIGGADRPIFAAVARVESFLP